MNKENILIIDDNSYEAWLESLRKELNEYLTAAKNVAAYSIQIDSNINNSVGLVYDKDDILDNIKRNAPNCISYRGVVNSVDDFLDTRFSNLVAYEENEIIKELLNNKIQEFEFLKYKVIGYEIYLHYPSVVYKIETGYVPAFKLSESPDVDDYEEDDDEETEEERLDREAYEKELEKNFERIENFAREMSQDKRLALTRNKDQRSSLAKMFFKERLDKSWDSWDIETMVVRAVNIFELEILPNLVSSLIRQEKTAKQVSDELGISLAKAKKVIAAVSE